MIVRFLVVLLSTSFFSCTFAGEDDFSSHNLINNIKNDLQSHFQNDHENYLNSNELNVLILELKDYYKYDNIVNREIIGRSAKGQRAIHAVHISRNVNEKRRLLKPMFKFVANIHGDDAVGYVMMVYLMQYLVHNDRRNNRITRMLDNIDIWIVPTLNPDGLAKSEEGRCDPVDDFKGKFNGNGIDLDADFPNGNNEKDEDRQSETRSMVQFLKSHPFVLSGNLQGGALVASYPWDSSRSFMDFGDSSLTQDNEIFKKLARDYAKKNPMMAGGHACNLTFPRGITNGKHWRKKRGGMQDANYILSNCFEITFYLGCCKTPLRHTLPYYWAANLESMLTFIESTRQGNYGLVNDTEGMPVKNAVIKVSGLDKEIKVTEEGEYWRLLLPGEYEVKAIAPGYFMKRQTVCVTKDEPYVRLDLVMSITGVHGQVIDPWNSESNVQTIIKVVEEGKEIRVPVNEDYWIPLNLGHYTISAEARGFLLKRVTVDVTEETPKVQLDLDLMRHGIHGRVEGERGKLIQTFNIKVENVSSPLKIIDRGGYWLVLDVGRTYYVSASASGYTTSEVREVTLTQDEPYVLNNFVLQRQWKNFLPCLKSPKP